MGWIVLAPLALLRRRRAVDPRPASRRPAPRTPFAARFALFWALARGGAALARCHGLVAGLVGPDPCLPPVGAVALAAFLWFWWAGARRRMQDARRDPRLARLARHRRRPQSARDRDHDPVDRRSRPRRCMPAFLLVVVLSVLLTMLGAGHGDAAGRRGRGGLSALRLRGVALGAARRLHLRPLPHRPARSAAPAAWPRRRCSWCSCSSSCCSLRWSSSCSGSQRRRSSGIFVVAVVLVWRSGSIINFVDVCTVTGRSSSRSG